MRERGWPLLGEAGCGGGGGGNATATSALAATTAAVLADFFAIARAAAVVVSMPRAERQESSFSTVAALAGDVPILLPFPRARGGKVADYETRGNGGAPMHGFFWLDDLNGTFLRAIADPSVRRPQRANRTR